MPLPDKHADEPTVELDPDIYRLYREARRAEVGWKKIADGYRAQIEQQIGDSFAATVEGVKVITYRPESKYAEGQLQKDYPDLTQHYRHEVTKEVFDMELFAKTHPEVAEQYRIRSFRGLDS